jgi:ligand-binding sensor domain-containing protein
MPNRGVTALAVDSSGNKWIGTIAGLVRYNGSTWSLVTRESTGGGLPHNSITHLAVSPQGDLWVGTQMGVARHSKGAWKSFKDDKGLLELAPEQVYRLSCENQASGGAVWIAAKGGAARFDGTGWTHYNRNNTTGIQTRFVYVAVPGASGEIWFGTQKGVSQMVPLPEE